MKQKFLICRHCGNVAFLLRDKGVPIYCCGEEMHQLSFCASEASEEKHIPVFRKEGNTVYVTVGSAEHPMIAEHYIEWICLESAQGIQFAKLSPDAKPQAKFALNDGDEIQNVYAFCNQHDLWRSRPCQ